MPTSKQNASLGPVDSKSMHLTASETALTTAIDSVHARELELEDNLAAIAQNSLYDNPKSSIPLGSGPPHPRPVIDDASEAAQQMRKLSREWRDLGVRRQGLERERDEVRREIVGDYLEVGSIVQTIVRSGRDNPGNEGGESHDESNTEPKSSEADGGTDQAGTEKVENQPA